MKLTDIKYSDLLLKHNQEDLESIVFMDEILPKEKTEIGILFGGASMIPNRVNKAIELYELQLINKILVTGGIGYKDFKRKIPEATELETYLRAYGIPKSDILVEDKSKNTLQNIKNSLLLLKDYSYDENTKIRLITSDFHLKRCYLMAGLNYNIENILASFSKDGVSDLENWKNSSKGRRTILIEAIRLCTYAKTGLMLDSEVEHLVKVRKK